MLSKIREDIKVISQGNVQIPLLKILEVLEIMGAKEAIAQHNAELERLEQWERTLPPTEDELLLEAEEKVRPLHGPDEMQLAEEENAETEGNAQQTEPDAPLEAGERE